MKVFIPKISVLLSERGLFFYILNNNFVFSYFCLKTLIYRTLILALHAIQKLNLIKILF